MRLPHLLLSTLLGLGLLGGCTTTPAPASADGDALTWVVVRHAEKATDDPEDPNLSALGQARAQRLAQELATAPVTAVYATEYKRTRQTGQPTADAHHVTITPYYAKGPANEVAAQLKAAHKRGTVLIVGHSNTVPDIVSALSGQIADPMPDTEYDRLTRIHVAADGAVRVEISRY